MLEWWYSLTIVQQIFACIAIAATVVMLIQTGLLLLGLGFGTDADSPELDSADGSDLDSDGHSDIPDSHLEGEGASHNTDAHDGLRLFTVRGIVAFFAVGGWTGLLLSKYIGNFFAVLLAFVAGNVALVGIALLMRGAYQLQDKGNLEPVNAVGKLAKVYLSIPPAGKGQGKITVMLQERLVELDAAGTSKQFIPTGAFVRICDLVDEDTVLVEPVEQAPEESKGGISKWIQS